MSKVAVVTGANKGIGFATVKGLCQKFNGTVYLTARDVEKGQIAVKELESLGFHPKFHQLDITDIKSVQNFRDFIKSNHDGIDILINNAAHAFKKTATDPFIVQAEVTLNVNYFSLVSACNELLPLMKKGGRVINLSSILGHLAAIPSKAIRAEFGAKDLTVFKLNELVNKFIDAVKAGTNETDGWGSNTYTVSKVAVSAYTFILHREWESKGLLIYCVHPGYVTTDMTSNKGHLKPDRGAQSTLYAALEAPESLKGSFIWDNSEVVDWYSDTLPPLATE